MQHFPELETPGTVCKSFVRDSKTAWHLAFVDHNAVHEDRSHM